MVRGVSRFLSCPRFRFAVGYPLFLHVADVCRISARACTDEKRGRRRAHDCNAHDSGVPSWCQSVIRALPEIPPEAPYSYTRNIPCSSNPSNQPIDHIALEAFNGANCRERPRGAPFVCFRTDSPSFPTVNPPALIIIRAIVFLCLIHQTFNSTLRSSKYGRAKWRCGHSGDVKLA